jgi:hypothetical protein
MKQILRLMLCLLPLLGMLSCSSDDEITMEDADTALVKSAREFLTGDIVLSTNATMNGVNKTLLETGCPTKFNFQWTGDQSFNLSLLNFTVGNMGMIINFRCNVKTMQLNSWEKNEYTGAGWIKFYGEDGNTWGQNEDGSDAGQEGAVTKGSFVQGYYNANTHQIQFIVSYNMMNVRSECFIQTIDKSRLANYEEEFAQYERDLAQYKKDHGLN